MPILPIKLYNIKETADIRLSSAIRTRLLPACTWARNAHGLFDGCLLMNRIYTAILSTAIITALLGWVPAQGPGDGLEQGFQNPPDSARPRTWWHCNKVGVCQKSLYPETRLRCKMRPQPRRRHRSRHIVLYQQPDGSRAGGACPSEAAAIRQLELPIRGTQKTSLAV